MNQNALRQVTIKTEKESLRGFSVSGVATYLQIPEADFCFDMGECPLSAVKLNHVALTHAHGDHYRCLMRHNSLRRMMGIEKPAAYLMTPELLRRAERYFREEARFEYVSSPQYTPPLIVAVEPGAEPIALPYRQDLRISAFALTHRIPTVGFTLYDYKKKLREEFFGREGRELAVLKQNGIEITRDQLDPRISYLGDTTIRGVRNNPQVWNSRIVIAESTFIEPGEEEMAQKKGHTHLNELAALLHELGDDLKSDLVVLNHFSMKCTKERITERVNELFTGPLREKIAVLV